MPLIWFTAMVHRRDPGGPQYPEAFDGPVFGFRGGRFPDHDLEFPRRFQDLDHARAHMAAFFADYNTNHRHSGLNYYTPDTVHHGLVEQARRQRQDTLDACHARNPHRYRRRPTAPGAPSLAGINYKETNQLSPTA